jgi:hypothetical protein
MAERGPVVAQGEGLVGNVGWDHAFGSCPELRNVTNADARTRTSCATTVGKNCIQRDFACVPTGDVIEDSF